MNQNRQKVNEFGSTREFLAPIIDSFEQDYIRYELTATNDGRYKAVFYASNHSITLDFIYMPNSIQTTIVIDKVLLGRDKRVWTTPYNCSIVERELRNRLMPGY